MDSFSEGLNLQGASQVVHLNTPTVIRLAEQRAGRVDRMDSPYETVDIWWPNDSGPFRPRRRDLLQERHDVVEDLIGSNLVMPQEEAIDGGTDGELDLEAFANQASVERRQEDPREFFDAFRSVRELVQGPTALVPPEVYDSVKDSQARVIACLSLVRSETPWAFFAVGGKDRAAPRWVYFERPDAPPEVDIARIAERLRSHLEHDRESAPFDEDATRCLQRFVKTLVERQRELLPVRRKRALEAAERCLEAWRRESHLRGDTSAVSFYQTLRACLLPNNQEEPHADLTEVANRWLTLIRSRQSGDKLQQRRRRGLRTQWLKAVARDMEDHPVPLLDLQEAFEELPTIQPITRRVVAAIVGVPAGEA
jgi:hypothetical protein